MVSKKRLTEIGWEEKKSQRKARKDSQTGKKRIKGREAKNKRQARKESKTGKNRLKCRQR